MNCVKIAVTGKGGVGKTTFCSVLARLYAQEGRSVLAVDVDPDANLGLALGFSENELSKILPISSQRELVQERTGVDDMNMVKFFKLNPKVDDIPDMFAREKNGVRLLVLGSVEKGGAGCVCPENVLLKEIISHLVLQDKDVVIMDMEAGLEHLGRGTSSVMEAFIVVVEPGLRSIQTYTNIKRMASDLGVRQVKVVANKIKDSADEEFINSRIPKEDMLGFIHINPDIAAADQKGASPYDECEAAVSEIRKIKEKIDGRV